MQELPVTQWQRLVRSNVETVRHFKVSRSDYSCLRSNGAENVLLLFSVSPECDNSLTKLLCLKWTKYDVEKFLISGEVRILRSSRSLITI